MSWKVKNCTKSLSTRLVIIFSLLITAVSALTFSFLYQVLKKENIRQSIIHAQDILRPYQDLYKTTRYTDVENNYEAYDENHYEYISPKKRTQLKLNEAFISLPTDIIAASLYDEKLKVFAESTQSPRFHLQFTSPTQTHHFYRQEDLAFFSLKNFDDTIFFIVLDQSESLSSLHSYRNLFIGLVLLIATISVLLSFFIVNTSLKSLFEIQKTSENIQQGQLNLRVNFTKKPATEIALLARSFNSMLDHIQILITELGDLTNNIAHDMRTPVTRIRSRAEFALMSNPDEKTEETLGPILEDCDHLNNLINDTLTIAQNEAGIHEQQNDEIDLIEQLTEIIDIMFPLAEEQKIQIKFTSPLKTARITVNAVQIQRTFSELLNNAIKYSSENSQINISCQEQSGQFIIAFKDHGLGISEKEKSRVFERFYRSDSSRSQQGNGLGLSLSKAFIEAHCGELSVESQLAEGSTFTVSLPATKLID